MAAADQYAGHAATARQLGKDLTAMEEQAGYLRPWDRSALALCVAMARYIAETCRLLADNTRGRAA